MLLSGKSRSNLYPDDVIAFLKLWKLDFGAKLADFEVEGDRPRGYEGSEFLGTFS